MEQENQFNISQESIDLMKLNYSIEELESMELNRDRILSSIMVLRELGVTDETIQDILVCEYNVLMPGKEYLLKALAKLGDIPKFVESLNKDINYIDYLVNIN